MGGDTLSRSFQPVKSADRVLEILEMFADAPRQLSLGEISQRLQIPKSSLHGLLRTMQARHWVESDITGTRFGLGVRSLTTGASYVETDPAAVRAQPVLNRLAGALGETVHLGRLEGPNVVYLAKQESAHPLRMFSSIGRHLPAHSTALGKAVLARLPWDEVDALLPDPLPALTRHTIVDRAALQDDLEETRQRGYAAEREENSDGIRCVAVCLDNQNPRDAISFSIPMLRLTEEMEQQAIMLLKQAPLELRSGGAAAF